jgi:hypothetical protein
LTRKYTKRCFVRFLPRRLHLYWHAPSMGRSPMSHGKRMWIRYSSLPCQMTQSEWERIVKRAGELAEEMGLS